MLSAGRAGNAGRKTDSEQNEQRLMQPRLKHHRDRAGVLVAREIEIRVIRERDLVPARRTGDRPQSTIFPDASR